MNCLSYMKINIHKLKIVCYIYIMVVQCIGVRCTECQNSCQFTIVPIVQPQRDLCVIRFWITLTPVPWYGMAVCVFYKISYNIIIMYQHACDQYVILHQFSDIRTMPFIMKLYKCWNLPGHVMWFIKIPGPNYCMSFYSTSMIHLFNCISVVYSLTDQWYHSSCINNYE